MADSCPDEFRCSVRMRQGAIIGPGSDYCLARAWEGERGLPIGREPLPLESVMDTKPNTLVLLDDRNALVKSIISRILLFGLLGLCIWISKGSTWWSLFTCALFLMYAWATASLIASKRVRQFQGLDELAAWVEGQRG